MIMILIHYGNKVVSDNNNDNNNNNNKTITIIMMMMSILNLSHDGILKRAKVSPQAFQQSQYIYSTIYIVYELKVLQYCHKGPWEDGGFNSSKKSGNEGIVKYNVLGHFLGYYLNKK
jgi:hypothetical protein